jgi:hypothetical protein
LLQGLPIELRAGIAERERRVAVHRDERDGEHRLARAGEQLTQMPEPFGVGDVRAEAVELNEPHTLP